MNFSSEEMIMDNFSHNCKYLRETKELSYKQLETVTGISRQTINNYEMKKSFPTANNLAILSQFFKVSTDDLLFTKCTNVAKSDSDGVRFTIDKDKLTIDDLVEELKSNEKEEKILMDSLKASLEFKKNALRMLTSNSYDYNDETTYSNTSLRNSDVYTNFYSDITKMNLENDVIVLELIKTLNIIINLKEDIKFDYLKNILDYIKQTYKTL
jgi:transcriptional regulator with XRE-family HTH domain|nr:helix-turn-helix transcriptional regulator [Clostridioides sp.]